MTARSDRLAVLRILSREVELLQDSVLHDQPESDRFWIVVEMAQIRGLVSTLLQWEIELAPYPTADRVATNNANDSEIPF